MAGIALIALAGCSSGGEGAADESPSETPTTTQVEAATLKDTCPLVERALPTSMAPPRAKLAEAADEIGDLAASGDVETQNALEPLEDSTRDLSEAEPGIEYSDAFSAQTAALQSVADRCAAVGSSALQ